MLRKYIQPWYKPQNKQHAAFRKAKLSLLYAFIAWNCFGVGFYLLMKERMPTDPVERRKSLRMLSGSPGNLHVYQYHGFKFKQEFDVEKEAPEETEEEVE